MGNIKLVTDSNSDLTDDIIKSYNIAMVPQYISLNGISIRDRTDITSEELNKKISSMDKLPKTSAPNPSDFYYIFKSALEGGQDVLCICTSSDMSTTYQNAVLAAQEFPASRIEVMDSRNISMGLGMIVLNAIDLIEQGFSNIHEIAEKLKKMVDKIKFVIALDTLEYIRKGGRCTALESFVGNILKIHPVLSLTNGKLIVSEKIRGSRERVLKELLKMVAMDKEKINLKRMVIAHFMSQKDVQDLKNRVEKIFNPEQIIVAEAGCSVSSHSGPNAIGIIYLIK